jgi:hypothetical protein
MVRSLSIRSVVVGIPAPAIELPRTRSRRPFADAVQLYSAHANEVDVMRSLSINDEVHGVMYGCVGLNGGAIRRAVDLGL